MKKIANNQSGFTLIELLVVISIISLLSGIVLGGLEVSKQKARGTQIIRTFKELQTALELYKSQIGEYPAQEGSEFFPNGLDAFDLSGDMSTDAAGLSHFEDALQPLVSKGFIASISHYPTWPNNKPAYYGGFYEYETDNPLPPGGGSWYCGDIAWRSKGYVLLVGSPQAINLPPLRSKNNDTFKDWSLPGQLPEFSGLGWYYYCITNP